MSTKLKMDVVSVAAIIASANAIGLAAGNGVVPTPMGIYNADVFGKPLPGAKVEIISEGACGFAWVSFPGNTSFGRTAKKLGLARKAYGGGLQISIHDHGQSVDRKQAHARAMAARLRAYGVDASSGSRLD